MERSEVTMNIVLSHAPCSDGFTASWASSKFLPAEETQFRDAVYGEGQITPEEVAGHTVYLLDFCYPKDVLLALCDSAKQVILLDHHKSAKENLEGVVHPKLHVVFDMTRSGCQITWDYFYQSLIDAAYDECHEYLPSILMQFIEKLTLRPWKDGEPNRPPLVDYVADRDLWKFELEDSREISEAIHSYDQSFETWDLLNAKIVEYSLIEEGKAILRNTRKQVQSAMELAYERRYQDEKIMVVNCASNISDVGAELCLKTPVKMSAIWFRQPDGRYKVSLRSTPDYDCSVVAKTLGGGGHRASAGAVCDNLPEWLT